MAGKRVAAAGTRPAAHAVVRLKSGEGTHAVAVEVVGDPAADAATELSALIGVTSPDALLATIRQITDACTRGGEIDFDAANFVLSVAIDAKPKDPFEAMLAIQMGLVHWHTTRVSRTLAGAVAVVQFDRSQNALNKLTRTYAAQLEALKRYRTGGEQKVTVEHVNVNAGGQAIVGAVSTGEGRGPKTEPTP